MRPGNLHSAEDWDELLLPEIDRQLAAGKQVAFGGDAAFAKPEVYESSERLSRHRFRANEVRLQVSVRAYNLGNLWLRLGLPQRIKSWSLTSLQHRLMKTGGRLVKHARYYQLCREADNPDGGSRFEYQSRKVGAVSEKWTTRQSRGPRRTEKSGRRTRQSGWTSHSEAEIA